MPEALLTVNNVISSASGYAESALAAANSALGTLAGMDVPYYNGGGIEIAGAFTPYSIPTMTPPSPFIPGTPPVVYQIQPPTPPSPPTLSDISDPSLITIQIPGKPSLLNPSMDSVTLGSMVGIDLPPAPNIDFRSFDITPPNPIVIIPGTWAFTVEDILIADDPMVVTIMDRIRNNVLHGGTGLTPAIEADIWDRDLERLIQASDDATDKLTSTWAKKGFSLPDGLLANSVSDLQKEFANKRIDRSREIAIEQARLEQSNLFKSMELGISLALKLIEQLNAYLEITFKAQEATAKYANEYIRLQIETLQSTIEIFKARVQAYEAEMKAAQAAVDVYKAQIEGELGKVTINKGTVEIYTAQITAAVQKYRGVLDGNESIMKVFSAEVQAVMAQAQVNESLVKLFAERVRAQTAKAEMFKAEVEGTMALIQGERAKVEANVAQVTVWAKGVEAQIAAYNGSVEAMRAVSSQGTAIASVNNAAAEVVIRQAIAKATLAVGVADATSRSITSKGAVMVEAAKGVAAAAAQMAAGAMAAVSANARVAFDEQVSYDGGEI